VKLFDLKKIDDYFVNLQIEILIIIGQQSQILEIIFSQTKVTEHHEN
jgi:hypothetical protein